AATPCTRGPQEVQCAIVAGWRLLVGQNISVISPYVYDSIDHFGRGVGDWVVNGSAAQLCAIRRIEYIEDRELERRRSPVPEVTVTRDVSRRNDIFASTTVGGAIISRRTPTREQIYFTSGGITGAIGVKRLCTPKNFACEVQCVD